jgi:hypothetical protein
VPAQGGPAPVGQATGGTRQLRLLHRPTSPRLLPRLIPAFFVTARLVHHLVLAHVLGVHERGGTLPAGEGPPSRVLSIGVTIQEAAPREALATIGAGMAFLS